MMNEARNMQHQEAQEPAKKLHDNIDEVTIGYEDIERNAASETAEQLADMKAIANKSEVAKAKDAAEQIADMRNIAAARELVMNASDVKQATAPDQIIPADQLAKASADMQKKAETDAMDQRRIAALREEVDVLGDVLKMRGIDIEAQSTKGLLGRLWGSVKNSINPDARKYQEKLALLNKLVTADEENKMTASDWNKRATRAHLSNTGRQSPGAGKVGRSPESR